VVTVWIKKQKVEQDQRDYFLPVIGKKKLVAGGMGSAAYVAHTNDICANYFNVLTDATTNTTDFANLTFQSELSFAPRQTVTGIGLQWQQRVKKFWLKASAPVTKVENDLRMTEEIINAGSTTASGAVNTMVDAFKQDAMKYGKIDGKQSKWGVADVEVMLGRDFIDEDHCQVSSYVGVVVPTGNKAKAEYLNEAIVGNGKHFGVMLGSSSRHVWKEGDNYVLAVCCEANSRYLFENTQKRMFDLNGKTWSRFLWLSKKSATVADGLDFGSGLDFGINQLTLDAKVKARGSFTANTALNLRKEGGFEAEVGMNLYARQAEDVSLKSAFANDDEYAIPALGNALNSWDASQSSSFSNIKRVNSGIGNTSAQNGDSVFNPIAAADLDLNSAAHPGVVENTVYGVLGMNWDEWKCPGFLGLGGSYTYSSDNAGMKRWGAWAKAGLSF
jgi:hypothetical protein